MVASTGGIVKAVRLPCGHLPMLSMLDRLSNILREEVSEVREEVSEVREEVGEMRKEVSEVQKEVSEVQEEVSKVP